MDGRARTDDEPFSSCLLNLTWESCYEQEGIVLIQLKLSPVTLLEPTHFIPKYFCLASWLDLYKGLEEETDASSGKRVKLQQPVPRSHGVETAKMIDLSRLTLIREEMEKKQIAVLTLGCDGMSFAQPKNAKPAQLVPLSAYNQSSLGAYKSSEYCSFLRPPCLDSFLRCGNDEANYETKLRR
ncbi:hypothetical protein F2P81_018489 [Scophthalmus maximus]|uniref:Uncharacterized protein n=1 Tax=Scophthalmus maximus TaxID=52904 RepID=A0A6A4SES8_SCOMX|nr:hypothetical protein F2P81_018489 [Scophthalmus maximus]